LCIIASTINTIIVHFRTNCGANPGFLVPEQKQLINCRNRYAVSPASVVLLGKFMILLLCLVRTALWHRNLRLHHNPIVYA
jgi:hypothetical protein